MIAKLKKFADVLLVVSLTMPILIYDLICISFIQLSGELLSNIILFFVKLTVAVITLVCFSSWINLKFSQTTFCKSAIFCIISYLFFVIFCILFPAISVFTGWFFIPICIGIAYILCFLLYTVFEKLFSCKVTKKFIYSAFLMCIVLTSVLLCSLVNSYLNFYTIYIRLVLNSLIVVVLYHLVQKLFQGIVFSEESESDKSSFMSGIIPIAGFMVVIFVVNINMLFHDSEKEIFKDLYDECSEYVNMANYATAYNSSQLLMDRRNVIDAVVNEKQFNIGEVYKHNMTDHVIGGIYLSKQNDLETIEDKVFKQELDSVEWKSILLKEYARLDNLTDDQKKLRKNLLVELMLDRVYVYPDVLLYDELKPLEHYKEDYTDTELLDIIDVVLECIVSYEKNGNISMELANKVLDVADSYPDNITAQYYGIVLSLNCRYDNASHYDRVADLVRRYDDLLRKDDYDTYYNLGMLMELCNHYEEAIEYYNKAYNLNGTTDVIIACARVCNELNDYENCSIVSDILLNTESSNADILYFKALSCLKARNVSGLVEAAISLSDNYLENEKYLYSLAHYISVKDSEDYTGYNYRVYNELTDLEIAELKKCPILWDYASALYYGYTDGKMEEALSYTKDLAGTYSDLKEVHYLEGVIYSNNKDYETALQCYKEAERSGLESKALYYAIANVCDALGDYNESYKYSMLIDLKYPNKGKLANHEEDLYGISYHNAILMDSLREELEKEDF